MEAMNTILDTQKQFEASINKRFNELDAALKLASPHTHPTIASLSKEVSTFKEKVSGMMNLLKQQICSVMSMVDTIEMRHRRKFLLFSGIPEASSEDITGTVVAICQNRLQLADVNKDSILVCHRLGALKDGRPRPVLVRFCDTRLRSLIWSKKTGLKGTPTVVSEFLTRERQSMFHAAREYFGMRRVWTMDGNIFVKLPSGKKQRLSSDEHLQSLMSQHAVLSSGSVTSETSASVPPAVPSPAPSEVTAPAPAGGVILASDAVITMASNSAS